MAAAPHTAQHNEGLAVRCLLQGVFLFGMSEGAVTLSTFNDEYFASMVRSVLQCCTCNRTEGTHACCCIK